jgi:hypothetical protein
LAAIISGVIRTPIRLDRVALKIAAGRLPRASEVIATEEEMVEGRAARKKKPSSSPGSSQLCPMAPAPSTRAGNRMKVPAVASRCSRQCDAPARIFSGARVRP